MKKYKIAVTVLLTTLLTSSLFADIKIQRDMKLTPDAQISRLLNEPVSLEPTDFIKAALIASGVPSSKLAAYVSKVETIYSNYEEYRTTKNTKLNDAEAGILYLYDKKILVDYIHDQTYLDILLDEGKFNCVSSAVLYMYMMKRRGYKVIANETPDHVFCTVMDEKGKQTDVETTSAFGYAPGKKKSVAKGDKKGSVSTEKEFYLDKKRVTGRRLIASIYSNRVFLEEQKPNPNPEKILQLIIDATELQNNTNEALQDLFFKAGSVMGALAKNDKPLEGLYIAKAIADKYGNFGKSEYMAEQTDACFAKAYKLNPEDFTYFDDLFSTYGNLLTKDTYDIFYEQHVYDKVINLVWNEEIPAAKELIIKGKKKLGYSEALEELEAQLEEANY